jgi:hypothetical protein
MNLFKAVRSVLNTDPEFNLEGLVSETNSKGLIPYYLFHIDLVPYYNTSRNLISAQIIIA